MSDLLCPEEFGFLAEEFVSVQSVGLELLFIVSVHPPEKGAHRKFVSFQICLLSWELVVSEEDKLVLNGVEESDG